MSQWKKIFINPIGELLIGFGGAFRNIRKAVIRKERIGKSVCFKYIFIRMKFYINLSVSENILKNNQLLIRNDHLRSLNLRSPCVFLIAVGRHILSYRRYKLSTSICTPVDPASDIQTATVDNGSRHQNVVS